MKEHNSTFYGQIRDREEKYWTLKKNEKFRLKTKEWDSEVNTNELGFREQITGGGTLFLGDSFTVSLRIDYEDTFMGRMAESHKVDNIALGGWSTREAKYYLKKYYNRYEPEQVVLVTYPQNDVWENFTRRSNLSHFHNPSILSKIPLGRTGLLKLNSAKKGSKLLRKLNLLNPYSEFSVYQENYGSSMRKGWKYTKSDIMEIKEFVEQNDAEFKLISMPSPWQLSEKWRNSGNLLDEFAPYMLEKDLKSLNFSRPEQILEKFTEERGIEFKSLYRSFEQTETPEDYYFSTVDHWNQKGHEKVFEKLQPFLT